MSVGRRIGLGTGYVRDSVGRLTQLTDSVRDAGGTLQVRRWSYVYDGVGRLLRDSLDGVLHQAVAYDSNGNRTSLTSASGTVSSSYDAQDRLVRSATSGGTVTRYAYGSTGELQTRTDSLSGARWARLAHRGGGCWGRLGSRSDRWWHRKRSRRVSPVESTDSVDPLASSTTGVSAARQGY